MKKNILKGSLVVGFGLIGVVSFYRGGLGDGGKVVYGYMSYWLMMMVYCGIKVGYG